MTNRRAFLLGLGSALAAPAVVKAESLMRIAALRESVNLNTIRFFPGSATLKIFTGTEWEIIAGTILKDHLFGVCETTFPNLRNPK